jgi:hypothetical protein
MKTSKQLAVALTAVCFVGAWLVAVPAAQSQTRKRVTSWGAPDLQGTWSFGTVTPLERPNGVTKEFLSPEEIRETERRAVIAATDEARGQDAARDVAGAYNDFWWDRGTRVAGRRTSLISDPPDGRMPPLTPEARKFADSPEARTIQQTRGGNLPAAGPEDTDLWDRCLTRGLPIVPGPYNNNIQILQTPTHVIILHEMIHDARIVPLAKTPWPQGHLTQWFGVARGYWEGDTLVVEARNISDKQELPFAPRMSAGGMHLTERFSRSPDGTLRYEFTVNHPTIYTRPWTAILQMAPSEGEIFEYACHEANYAMEGILKGSRLLEKTAQASTRR